MFRMFSIVTMALVLSAGWWSPFVSAIAEALGIEEPIEGEQSLSAPPPETPPTDSGCSMDPWGCPKG